VFTHSRRLATPLLVITFMILGSTVVLASHNGQSKTFQSGSHLLIGSTSGTYYDSAGRYHNGVSTRQGPAPATSYTSIRARGWNSHGASGWHIVSSNYAIANPGNTASLSTIRRCGDQSWSCNVANYSVFSHYFQDSRFGVKQFYTSSDGFHSAQCWYNNPNTC
jgi:hypothetical protein